MDRVHRKDQPRSQGDRDRRHSPDHDYQQTGHEPVRRDPDRMECHRVTFSEQPQEPPQSSHYRPPQAHSLRSVRGPPGLEESCRKPCPKTDAGIAHNDRYVIVREVVGESA